MRNISILIWSENIAITLQKTWFLKKNFLKNFSAKDRTGDLWVMSSITRPLHQKILLEKRAKNNASWSAKWIYRAAGISNAQIFKTLRSARQFMLQVGNSNSFDMCSGWSKVCVWQVFLMFFAISSLRGAKIASPSGYIKIWMALGHEAPREELEYNCEAVVF